MAADADGFYMVNGFLLIYAIREMRGDEAPGSTAALLIGGFSLTNEELRRSGGRIVMNHLPDGSAND